MKNDADPKSARKRRARRELTVLSLIPAAITLILLILALVFQGLRITARLSPLIALPLLCYVPALHRRREERRRERLGEKAEPIPALTKGSYVRQGNWKLINIAVICLIVALAIFLPSLDWILENGDTDLWGPIGFFIAVPVIAAVSLLLTALFRSRARRKLLKENGLRLLELPLVKKDAITTRDSVSSIDDYDYGKESTSYYLDFPEVYCRGKAGPVPLSFSVDYLDFIRAREGEPYYVLVDVLHADRALEGCYPKFGVRLGTDMLLLKEDLEELNTEHADWTRQAEEAEERKKQEEDRLRRMKAVGGEALREYRKQYREEHREELRKKRFKRWGFLLAGILFSAAAPFILPFVFSFDLGWSGVLLVLGVFAYLFAELFVLVYLGDRWGILWFFLTVILLLAGPFLGWL